MREPIADRSGDAGEVIDLFLIYPDLESALLERLDEWLNPLSIGPTVAYKNIIGHVHHISSFVLHGHN